MGWIGVDLDGTLASWDGNWSLGEVGKPIPLMVSRVKAWLAEGKDVRICTARLAATNPVHYKIQWDSIQQWLREHVGQELQLTNEKDTSMVELWDDRAVQVIPDTGIRVDSRNGWMPITDSSPEYGERVLVWCPEWKKKFPHLGGVNSCIRSSSGRWNVYRGAGIFSFEPTEEYRWISIPKGC